MELFEKICSEYKNYIYIFAFSGLGDICYSLSILESLKRKTDKKILVITREYSKKLIECYHEVDACIVLNDADAKKLEIKFCRGSYSIAIGNNRDANNIFSCDPLTYEQYCNNLQYKNYLEYLRNEYNVEKSKTVYPKVVSKIRRSKISNPKNAVILNPYSNTLKCYQNVFCEISSILRKNGLDVYTNVVGTQKPIAGTQILNCSIDEFYTLSKSVKAVIGIRSGIFDFSIGSGGNFIVLYDDMWNGEFKNAYSLKTWGTESTVHEFYLSDKDLMLNEVYSLINKIVL